MPQVSQFNSFPRLEGRYHGLAGCITAAIDDDAATLPGALAAGGVLLVMHTRKRGELSAPFYNGLIYQARYTGTSVILRVPWKV